MTRDLYPLISINNNSLLFRQVIIVPVVVKQLIQYVSNDRLMADCSHSKILNVTTLTNVSKYWREGRVNNINNQLVMKTFKLF